MTTRILQRTAADRCPGALELHPAQDGWLARVRIPGGRVTADQLVTLSHAASLGNGLVELTSRANLQLRGFPAGAGDELAAIVADAGLLPSPPHDRARNVIASPVAGRHPHSRADTDDVVDAVDLGLCADPALAELPGRFLFAVDDGSGIALDQPADVAIAACDAGSYSLALAGQTIAHRISSAEAATLAVAAAAAFLAERERRGGGAWRIVELHGGAAAIAGRLGVGMGGPLPAWPTVEMAARPVLRLGHLQQRDGLVALTAMAPLGRLDGRDLVGLAAIAPEVRVGTGRTVTVRDVGPADIAAVHSQLASLGLVLEPDSGWVGLTACAGLGRCPKALLDVRSAAAVRAAIRRAGASREHWAACERRCGEHADQPTSIAASSGGLTVRAGKSEHLAATLVDAMALLAS